MRGSDSGVARVFFVISVVVLCFGGGLSLAWSPYGNDSALPNKGLADGPDLPFDPNDYMFLIYQSPSREDMILLAMEKIGVEEDRLTVCDRSHPVTANLLASHDILIVGWDASGDENMKEGLSPQVIEQGITGKVILSGHDSDYHTMQQDDAYAAMPFFIQEIDYVLQGGGTGMIVCADPTVNFTWLPESWGVVATSESGATITDFTQEGVDSGIFDGLTPAKMSNWSTSYHNTFDEWGIGFRPFELGEGDNGDVVVTIGTPVNVYGIAFRKDDDVDEGECRGPGDEITYTISWDNSAGISLYDLKIVDYLPAAVTYPGADYQMDPNDFFNPIPPDPAYDPNTHSYTWDIGDIDPNDTGSVTITVEMNEWAAPGMTIRNVAHLYSGESLYAWASEDTRVCCWDTVDPNIIYVDETASGYDNGTSWDDAYTDLQRALARATQANCEIGPYTILVAQGVYNPGDWTKDMFVLPDGASLYGGFMSGGSDWPDRNPDKYPTALTGYIGLDENEHIERNEVVVMMGDNTRLDGFVVEESSYYGIYGEGVSFTLANCDVADNEGDGVFVQDGDVVLQWCEITNNADDGIRHTGAGYTLSLENCQLVQNKGNGILTEDSTPSVKNSAIARNGFTGPIFFGMRIATPAEPPVVHNNTIAYNANEGISFVDNEPNVWEREYPDIQNCILWYNNDGGEQMAGCDFTQYSCVYDPNDPDGVDYAVDGFGNFSGNPGFAYEYSTDPNVALNVHLAFDSPCIDMGSELLSYTGQLDIDGEERVVGTYADVGADEVYSADGDPNENDLYNSVDWTADGIVNMHEFGIFARAWLSVDPNNPLCDPNNPNYVSDPNLPDYITEGHKRRYSARCDIDKDLDVDLLDLGLFCDEWLWMACWKESDVGRFEMMGMAMGGGESMMMSVPMTAAISMDGSPIEYVEPEAAFTSESDLGRFIAGVNAVIDFVDATIEQDPSNSKHLYDLKASLEDVLWELYDSIDVK